jgi:hypothetical protein
MIARYMPSEQIEVGRRATMLANEVCAYEEDGDYIGSYSEMSPQLKPRPGWWARRMGRQPPHRNHLFVSNGPHKMIMIIESKWSNREEGNICAILTINIPTDHVGRLFSIAREADEGIVTAQTLVSAVELDISSRFRTYVMSLHDPDDFVSAEDFIKIENEFQHIADNELSKLGVNVESVSISYGNTSDDDIDDLQKSVDLVMKENMSERRLRGEIGFDNTSAALDAVADSIEAKATMLAHGELSDRSAQEVAREMVEAQERELFRRIADKEAEAISASKIRGVELKSQEDMALVIAAQALQNLVGATEGGGDGSDGDE